MCPSISGKSGIGKCTLAVHTARTIFKMPVHLQNCDTSMTATSLTLSLLIDGGKGKLFQASPLVSALLTGAAVVLKDAGRLSERCWSLVAPLLDERQWLDVPSLGLRLRPKPGFRLCATINEGSLIHHVPDFIHARLAPRLRLEMPAGDDLEAVLRERSGMEDQRLVELVAAYVRHSREHVSVREGLHLLDFTRRIAAHEGLPLERAFQASLKAHARAEAIDPKA
ncbi:MAG: AAA family ATPase [Spirochaetes bacterium]|nr:AAA family ATPase [Spirochaetota bacterium]